MSHRVALYTVTVRRKGHREERPLGAFDESGTASLLEVLADYLQAGFLSRDEEAQREFLVESSTLDEDEEGLAVIAKHGKSGVRATIVDPDGQTRLEQLPSDSQLLSCACLFRIVPQQDRGWLALHLNDNHGTKTLLEAGIKERFDVEFEDYTLRIRPFVERAVLDQAIAEGKIEKVKLTKLERPSDEAMAITRRWIPGAAVGKFELSITARTRGEHLLVEPLRRLIGNQDSDEELIEFEGVEFDRASVQVKTEDGGRRTFDLSRPEAGHPFTEELEDLDYEDAQPTPASLLGALRAALDRVT